ncbi:MAG: ABC transporter ATP-binding protein [Bacteroidales bacterium]|nr:ABC transporter ATP-binding protein [Bacteroidales bacterium]
MIEIQDIHKKFGHVHVLKGINETIQSSEIVSIVGPSGAGKTTLLHLIGTLSKPDQGKILIDGVNIFQLNDKELSAFRNRKLGFVFQFHQLLPEFTALENACIPAFIAGKSRKEAAVRAEELLSYLGLADRMHHKPTELSGGEQQRVAIARALINSPSLLLADEPSGNLDVQNKQELHHLFFSLRETFKITIVVVTHDTGLADMADRKIILQDGKILA